MRLVTHHLTSRGGRPENQDAVRQVVNKDFALLALADGLGGQGGGALAARCCVETVAEAFARSPSLSDAHLQALVDEADQTVASLRLEQWRGASSGGMRTTLALLAVCNDIARWAHVGDSRVYWFRNNVLMHRTRDHSVSELVAGLEDDSLTAPPDETDRHRLLRVVGGGEGCRAELGETAIQLRPGDAFMLCSDGVWSLIPDAEITTALSKVATPADWCAALEGLLKQQFGDKIPGKIDDYSMILGMVFP
jgi:PPM family protein phosphatase